MSVQSLSAMQNTQLGAIFSNIASLDTNSTFDLTATRSLEQRNSYRRPLKTSNLNEH